MGRILSIDYGRKRIGLAVSDPQQIIAGGLDTVPTFKIWGYLNAYFAQEGVTTVVIGYPLNLDNSPSEAMKGVEKFAENFRRRYPSLKVVMYDERFTSVLATQAIRDAGAKKKTRQNKGLIDKVSATIILQDYMNYLKFKTGSR